ISRRPATVLWPSESMMGVRSSSPPAPIARSRISTAIVLATSPPAWPPMPSATTNSDSSGKRPRASSLWSRLRPTSVWPAARTNTGRYTSSGRSHVGIAPRHPSPHLVHPERWIHPLELFRELLLQLRRTVVPRLWAHPEGLHGRLPELLGDVDSQRLD